MLMSAIYSAGLVLWSVSMMTMMAQTLSSSLYYNVIHCEADKIPNQGSIIKSKFLWLYAILDPYSMWSFA